jgi:ABC-type multidrug transport system ATPase subunit
MGLPQGYDTRVGENASLISGGQAQRLQIARALARPWTKIMILDECTSSLDAENQAFVLDTIRRLTTMGGDSEEREERKTTLMITHKLQIMQMCDRILVVDQGEIVEDGTFEQLIEMGWYVDKPELPEILHPQRHLVNHHLPGNGLSPVSSISSSVHAAAEITKPMLTVNDMLSLLSVQFHKPNGSRKTRIDIFDFYAALLTKLGAT